MMLSSEGRNFFKHHTRFYLLLFLLILGSLFLTSCSFNEDANSIITPTISPTKHKTSTPTQTTPSDKTPTATSAPTATPILNQGWGIRYEESLDGTWEFVKVASLDDPVPTHGWEPIEVPSQFISSSYERVWYRKIFTTDSTWEGKRISLHFGGIKYNSTIYVNGNEAGGCFNGHEPFEVDITDAVIYGAENEILVGVHNWTGLLSSPVPLSEGISLGDIFLAEDRLLSPISTNSDFMNYGIWDSATLRVTDPVFVTDLFIHTLVSESRLDIDISVSNSSNEDAEMTVTARIFPWLGGNRDDANQWPLQGNPVLISEGQILKISANQTAITQITFNDPPLALWTPYQPNLYVLEISLGKAGHDSQRVRFGYREIAVDGADFYLNGEKIHLLSVVWFEHRSPDAERIREELLGVRAMNVNTIRLMEQQFKLYYELADEIGLLMIFQADVGNGETVYRLRDPVFWQNYQQRLLSSVASLKNHPSVIMWSLTAEFYHEILRSDQAVIGQLAGLAEAVRAADGSRPVLFSMDGDPGGAADVLGYHYPNEPNVYPDQRYWPAAAYYADQPIVRPLDWVYESSFTFWDSDAFLWDRSKPLYIGEQLCFDRSNPKQLTPFVGDEAFLPYHDQYDPRIWYDRPLFTTKATAFEMQILASRQQGVSGFSMFGEFKGWSDGTPMLFEENPEWVVMREMNQPLAAFLADYDNRFFSGETIPRKIALFNDTMQPQPGVTFKWSLQYGERVLSEGHETLSMPAGDIREHDIFLTMPAVEQRTEIILQLQMVVEDEIHFIKEYTLVIFPNLEDWHMPNRGIALYDPDDSLSHLWREDKGVFILESLDDWNGNPILILGKNATRGLPQESLLVLREKVQQGGRVLAIEQDPSISNMLPVTFSGFGSSIAFLQTPSHPIMKGFQPEDFRWWRGDLLVSYADPVRVGTAGMTHLIASGSMKGMNSAPLLEIKQGQGHWILSQLAVISKLEEEPIAPHLLQAMLDYLDSLPEAGGKVVLHDPTGEIQESENFLEIDWQIHDPEDPDMNLSTADVFILHKALDGLENYLEELDQFVNSGGVLLLDQPEADLFSELADHWNLNIAMESYGGTAYLNFPNTWENAENLMREDFLWLTETEPSNLMASAMASGATESVFLPKEFISERIFMGSLPGSSARYGEVFYWDNSAVFFANDLYEWDITVPESETGQHIICLQAKTNYVGDDPPEAAIWIDEKLAGIVTVSKAYLLDECVWVENIQPGTRRLGIEYLNRNSDPAEFKELEIQTTAIQAVETHTDKYLISTPTAIIAIPIGEGELIINGIQWQHGGWRGQRLFAGLLTSLGTSWQLGNAPIIIEGEDMTVKAWHPWYSQLTDHTWLINDATLTGDVAIPSDGNYKLVLLGKGLILRDHYPVFQVYLDGVYQGQIEIDSDHWQFHNLDLALKKGEYTLSLVFGNNDFDLELGFGREVWLDQVRLYKE
jgi:hypothetical protein